MHCACDKKMGRDNEWTCECDWKGWLSIVDFPDERKNKNLPFAQPQKDGTYYVRCQSGSADRYEETQEYSTVPRDGRCGYTGKPLKLHWSGDDEGQPYAWRDLRGGDE